MKPIDGTSDSYTEYNGNSNKKDPKFKAGDYVRISKYKNIFPKGYIANWSKEVFVVSKIKNTVPWTYDISDLNGEEIAGSFHGKQLQRASQVKLKEKAINYTLSGKYMTIHLIVGLIKKHSIK